MHEYYSFLSEQEVVRETGSSSDFQQRHAVFQKNHERILKHNAREDSNFKLALNHMADWLPHELGIMFPAVTPLPANYTQQHSNFQLENRHATWPNQNTPERVDWSTEMNPLGRSIVPIVKNQGMCGSCWAFVSVACTESSIYITQGMAPPPLSVQELVDCDVEYNRGCYGGNPILAFDYIMNKGTTSWEEYPYSEGKGKCRRAFLEPRAKIDGFIMISSFDQKNLKKFVATGPVSIGICGTDFSFMFYAGGVYDSVECCTVQNHAMVIVGYGTDTDTGIDYWLLQNSWGSKWGESGFMRIKRTEELGVGLCGLASNPTMALGGRILSINNGTSSDTMHDIYAGANVWLDSHWKIIMFFFAFLLMLSSVALFRYAIVKRRRVARIRRGIGQPADSTYGAV